MDSPGPAGTGPVRSDSSPADLAPVGLLAATVVAATSEDERLRCLEGSVPFWAGVKRSAEAGPVPHPPGALHYPVRP
jgi:hypothetical protein